MTQQLYKGILIRPVRSYGITGIAPQLHYEIDIVYKGKILNYKKRTVLQCKQEITKTLNAIARETSPA